MTRIEPPVGDASAPFWDATRERLLVVQWCDACARPIFYPREVCPSCLTADSLAWRRSSGEGTVHAVSVQHRPGNPTMVEQVPYAVVLVDVDAGGADGETVRMMSNVVGCEAGAVAVGQAVRITWEEMSDGRNLPLFEPAGGS